jgi:hypothetical protein
MNIKVWFPPVLVAVIGTLALGLAGSSMFQLTVLSCMPVVPMDETQFRAAFAAYQAVLGGLSPPAERNGWQLSQVRVAVQRLAVSTGTHRVSPTSVVRMKLGTGIEG